MGCPHSAQPSTISGSFSLINSHGLSCAQIQTALSYFVPPTSIGRARGFPSHGINTGDTNKTKGVLAEA